LYTCRLIIFESTQAVSEIMTKETEIVFGMVLKNVLYERWIIMTMIWNERENPCPTRLTIYDKKN